METEARKVPFTDTKEFREGTNDARREATLNFLREQYPDLDFSSLNNVEFEFEEETEERVYVRPIAGADMFEWPNYFLDVYNKEKSVRVRTKNGRNRLSVKIADYDRDTKRGKFCWRIEIKPQDQVNQELFERIKEVHYKGMNRAVAKRGAPVTLLDGRHVWINQDVEDPTKYWLDLDIEPEEEKNYKVERNLPPFLEYLGHYIPGSKEAYNKPIEKSDFVESFIENNRVLSRTMGGKVDTSVSSEKQGTTLTPEQIQAQAEANMVDLAEAIWENKDTNIETPEQLRITLEDIARKANFGIGDLKYRTWEVKYGRKVPPDVLEGEMSQFFVTLFDYMKLAEKGNADPFTIAGWTEWEVNSGIHPYADAVGRISRAWSAFILLRANRPLPMVDTRENYYNAMNSGYFDFLDYFKDKAGVLK